ncbi:MAG: efflux RND transporter periplasmic adaptor subunit, partial [Rhodocyclaceae bacterium]|nr:efflux RND transporter periplasmic adaptor subunit [Rhodocyclaceae bacterium]
PAATGLPARPGRKNLECMIEPSLEVNLGSPVDGVIEEIRVDRGALVSRGQVLVRLSSAVEAAAVNLARGKEEFARRKAERNEELFRKELISAQEKDQLETEARLAQLELREKQEMLRQRSIASPINGVVAERFLAPGDQIGNRQILKLARIHPLHVEIVAPIELFGKVGVGTPAEVTPELLKQTHKARVAVIDRVIDAASGTFRLRLELPNPKHEIPAGLRCQVRFPGIAE